MALPQNPDFVFRDFVTDGIPSSGAHEPIKSEIRRLLNRMDATAAQGVAAFATKAELDAYTSAPDNSPAYVYADPVGENNGYYAWDDGGSEWVKLRDLPDTIARVDLNGPANAQTGDTQPGINPAAVLVFFAFAETPNTGPMTLSIEGESPRDVVNAAGNPLAAGEWTGGVQFWLNDDGDYQLINDAGSAISAAQSASAAQQWAQSPDPISEEAGGDGETDQSSKTWASRSKDDADRAAANALAVVARAWFKTVPDLLNDNNSIIGYDGSGADFIVSPGDIIEAQGFRYEVAASGASDAHVITAGGVKLDVVWDADTTVEAWGADASLDDNAPFFARALEASGRAICLPKRVYRFGQRVPIKNSVVIDFRGSVPEWGGTAPQTAANADLFVLTADVDYVKIFNVGAVSITGVADGDYCYKNFYSSYEDSSTIVGFPQGSNLKSWRAKQTIIQWCNLGASRVQAYGLVDQGDTLDYMDNTHIDDQYVIRTAALLTNGHFAPNILRNRFEAHFYEDIIKASPSKFVKIQSNVFKQTAHNSHMTQAFLAQVDTYSGVDGDDISNNHFYNAQIHRKQTGGEGPTIDAGMDICANNYFEITGDPGAYGGPLNSIYWRGARSVIMGNRVLVRLDDGVNNEVVAVDLDREEGAYDFANQDSSHAIVASGNLIDMRTGGGGANMYGFQRNPGSMNDTQESVALSGNIVLGGSRFINGYAHLTGGNVWRQPKNGGTGITVGLTNVGNSLRGGGGSRGRLHDNNLEFGAVSSSTPSVKLHNFLRVAGQATITDLLDGHEGQEVTIYARLGTTVAHSSNLRLKGEVNAVMPGRSTLTLVKVPDGDVGWQEKSRSF